MNKIPKYGLENLQMVYQQLKIYRYRRVGIRKINRLINQIYPEGKESEYYLRELKDDTLVLNSLTGRKNKIGVYMLPLHSIAAYIITRKVKPEKIVETGVHHGKSTTCILRAIQKNQGGFLHSIDLPKTVDPNNPYQEANVYELKEEEVGRLVPDELKSRWNLHLGDSRDILPKILEEIGPIDFFMHDSMHSYEVMSFEFKHALNSLNEEGVLLSDDVDWNNAFQDFVSKHKPDLNKAGDTSDIPKKYSENMSVIGLMSK